MNTLINDNEFKANFIASQIGFYYFENSIGVNLNARINNTTLTIQSLGITNIAYENGIVTITLYRPGLLIGKAGRNIDSLTEYIKQHVDFDFTGIKLIENKLFSYLYTFQLGEEYE
jgi:hypothetical protein